MSAMWVSMARALAQAGVASLRFDLAGVGDSPSRPGRRRPFYDMEAAFADTGAAIGWLAARGFGKVTLAGFCWGAQLATNLAFRDLRVTGLALVNARRQFWEMDAPQAPPIGRRDLYRMVRDPAMWRKLTDLRTLPRRSALASVRIGLRALEKLGVAPPPRDGGPEAAAAKLRSLAARGVDSLILQGSADTFLEEFEAYFGVPRDELPEVFGMSMAFPPGVDHLIRTREDMDAIAAAVVRHVSAPAVPARRAG